MDEGVAELLAQIPLSAASDALPGLRGRSAAGSATRGNSRGLGRGRSGGGGGEPRRTGRPRKQGVQSAGSGANHRARARSDHPPPKVGCVAPCTPDGSGRQGPPDRTDRQPVAGATTVRTPPRRRDATSLRVPVDRAVCPRPPTVGRSTRPSQRGPAYRPHLRGGSHRHTKRGTAAECGRTAPGIAAWVFDCRRPRRGRCPVKAGAAIFWPANLAVVSQPGCRCGRAGYAGG